MEDGRSIAQRISPAQSLNTTEVAVRADPFSAILYCQCRKIGIGDQIAFGIGLLAKLDENRPVSRPGLQHDAIGRRVDLFGEFYRAIQRAGRIEYAGMGDHAKNR